MTPGRPTTATPALITSCGCAHALRELQAVADAAPAGQWCWAAQAADALTTMQTLVREAISKGQDAVDPATLATHIHSFRSAALIGARQTADSKRNASPLYRYVIRRALAPMVPEGEPGARVARQRPGMGARPGAPLRQPKPRAQTHTAPRR